MSGRLVLGRPAPRRRRGHPQRGPPRARHRARRRHRRSGRRGPRTHSGRLSGGSAQMKALITNDDGVESPGLVTLAQAANAAGLEVLVAAPSWNSSGASYSLTGVERYGRLPSKRLVLSTADHAPHAVDAG